ncbi:tRNA(Ile)-lysidine synthase [Jatrophihabitans sp. GAS493]|uniref:tRNA lysidine(34) synthetase TilS n=1 Tax=Jatrophihabitans sp. GAS493 TaxID=1907575 RepID=UPI000BC08709|nr:tRNA lysidine(34) synthetase TilS [Jatrophihabitans sp. GAS493]SOD70572.1 tRNA(Ile)-lysidine synthase [Jatrophihabitans sp. GAS493]
MGPAVAVAKVRLAVRATLRRIDLSSENQPVFVACSGGSDSLSLAAALAFETRRRGNAGLVTVDHGLQPGSGEQAARVAQFGYDLGLDPVVVLPVRVARRHGPEADARSARYRALDGVAAAHGAKILLGHTLDDQAETVLLGLGRGSGPRSIAGMREARGEYLRPLLGLRREVTQAACEALGLTPWQDPHNDDLAYQRVRLRRLLPQLEEALQGGVAEALARTATLLQDDLDALDELAESALAATAGGARASGERASSLEVPELRVLPKAIRTRVIRLWVANASPAAALSAAQTADVEALVSNWRGQGAVDLPGGFAVVRSSGRLELIPPHGDVGPRPAPTEPDG